MYTAFYQFRETPFLPDPNPDFIYLSDTYETALAVLANGLANEVVVSVVLGETGMGKTTFIEYLLRRSPPGSAVGLIRGNVKSPRQMLKLMIKNFDLTCNSSNTEECYQQFVNFLYVVRKQQTQPPLLIIDEAHAMGGDVLKFVSKLCAVKVGDSPLLQLVLIGRKGLLDLLKKPELKAFSRQIGASCYLEPLTAEETKKYIHHRLETAGAANSDLFDEESCLTIYGYTKGNPKAINELCQDALICGGAQRVDRIDSDLIRKVAGKAKQPDSAAVRKIRSPVPRKIVIPWYKKVNNTTYLVAGVFLGVLSAMLLVPAQFFSQRDTSQTASINNPLEKNQNINRTIDDRSMRLAKSDQAILIEATPPAVAKKQPDNEESVEKQNLFAAAEGHLQARRLTTPKGDNAYEVYQSILDRDPDNRAAEKGLDNIVGQYQQLAEKEMTLDHYGKAKKYLQNALAVRPEAMEIQQALDQVSRNSENVQQAENSAKPRNNKPMEMEETIDEDLVEKQVRLAQQQFDAEKYLMPESDNAYKTYTNILSKAPNEERALAGLERIADRYLKLAQTEQSSGNLEEGRLFIESGLRVKPEHPELLSLNQQIAVKLKEQSREGAVNQMVKRSQQQIADLKLTQPQGDNAYATYKEILAIDKDNQEATEGLSEVQRRLTAELEDAMKNEDYKSALDAAEQVLAIPSDDVDDSYRLEAIVAAVDAKKYVKGQLENLLEQAESLISTQQLAGPPGQNAFDTYHRVLRIDPANKSARQGLAKIAREYENLVKTKLSAGDYRQALRLVDEGLNSFRNDAVLTALRDDVERQQVESRQEELKADAKAVVNEKTEEDASKKKMKAFGTF